MSFFGRFGASQYKYEVEIQPIRLDSLCCTDPVLVRLARGKKSSRSTVCVGRGGLYDLRSVKPLVLTSTLYKHKKRDTFLSKEAHLDVLTCKGSERLFGRVVIDVARYISPTEGEGQREGGREESAALEKCLDKRALFTFRVTAKRLKGEGEPSTTLTLHNDNAEESGSESGSGRRGKRNVKGNAKKSAQLEEDVTVDLEDFFDDDEEEEEEEVGKGKRNVDVNEVEDEEFDRPLQARRPLPPSNRNRAPPLRKTDKGVVDRRQRKGLKEEDERRRDVRSEKSEETKEEMKIKSKSSTSQNQSPNRHNSAVEDENEDEGDHDMDVDEYKPDNEPAPAVFCQYRSGASLSMGVAASRRSLPNLRNEEEEQDNENMTASESEEILEDDDSAHALTSDKDDEVENEMDNQDVRRKVKFGLAMRKLSTDQPLSPHHQFPDKQPGKGSLKSQVSPTSSAEAKKSPLSVDTLLPLSTPPKSSTPIHKRRSPKTVIPTELHSAKPILLAASLKEAMTLNPLSDPSDTPFVLDALLQALERNGGFETEGVFRISAESKKVDALKSQLQNGNYKIGINVDPHVIASTIKIFITQLNAHDHLIPLSLHDQCLRIGQIDDHQQPQSEQVEVGLQRLISSLPSRTKRLLSRLSVFIYRLSSQPHVQRTRMNLHALAVVFAPAVLVVQLGNKDSAFTVFNHAKHVVRFLEHLIEHRHLLDEHAFKENYADNVISSLEPTIASASLLKTISSPLSCHANVPDIAHMPSLLKTSADPNVLQFSTIPGSRRVSPESRGASARPPLSALHRKLPYRTDMVMNESDTSDEHDDDVMDGASNSSESKRPLSVARVSDMSSESAHHAPTSPAGVTVPQEVSRPMLMQHRRFPVSTAQYEESDELDENSDGAFQKLSKMVHSSLRSTSIKSQSMQRTLPHSSSVTNTQSQSSPLRSAQVSTVERKVGSFEDESATDEKQHPTKETTNSFTSTQKLVSSDQQSHDSEPHVDEEHSLNPLPPLATATRVINSKRSPSNTLPHFHSTVLHQPGVHAEQISSNTDHHERVGTHGSSQDSQELHRIRSMLAKYEEIIAHYKEVEAARAMEADTMSQKHSIDAKDREILKEHEIMRLKQEKELKKARAELEDAKQQLEASNSALNKRNLELADLKAKRCSNNESEEHLKAAQAHVAELTATLSEQSQELNTLHEKIANTDIALSTKDEEIAVLKTQIAASLVEHKHLIELEKSAEQQRIQLYALQQQVVEHASSSTSINDLEQHIDELQHECEELRSALHESKGLLDESKSKIATLEIFGTRVSTLPQHYIEADTSVPENDSEYEIYEDDTDEVVDLKQRVMKLKRLVHRKSDELKRIKRSTTSAQSTTSSTDSASSTPTNVDHSECQRVLRSIQDRMVHQQQEMRDELAHLQDESRLTVDELHAVQKLLEAKELQVTELVNETKELKINSVSSANSNGFTLSSQPPLLSQSGKTIKDSDSKDRIEIARLHAETQSASLQLLSLEQQLAAKDTRIAEYEKRLSEYQVNISDMETEAQRMRELNTDIQAQAQMNTLDSKTEMACILHKQTDEGTEAHRKTEERIVVLEQLVASLTNDKQALERDLSNMRNNTGFPLTSAVAISSVTAQRELTKQKENFEQLKIKFESLKVDSRTRLEVERKQQVALEEQVLALQEENEMLHQRHMLMDEFTAAVHTAAKAATTGRGGKVDRFVVQQTTALLQVARDQIGALERHIKQCDEVLRTAKESWAASSHVLEAEVSRLTSELEQQSTLLAQALENKPVEYSQIELLNKKLLKNERARDALQRELDKMETRIQKEHIETERSLQEAAQCRQDNEALKAEIVKQGIALKTIADDNFELKEWMRLKTKGRKA